MAVAVQVDAIQAGPEVLGDEILASERRKEVSAPVLRTFIAIADLWKLNEEQRRRILGYPARSTYHKWVAKAREHEELILDFDVLIRISLVLGIYSGLRILRSTEQQGTEWLRRASKSAPFNGQAPLDVMTTGHQDSLYAVRRYIDGARGGLFLAPNEADENFKPYTDANIIWS